MRGFAAFLLAPLGPVLLVGLFCVYLFVEQGSGAGAIEAFFGMAAFSLLLYGLSLVVAIPLYVYLKHTHRLSRKRVYVCCWVMGAFFGVALSAFGAAWFLIAQVLALSAALVFCSIAFKGSVSR